MSETGFHIKAVLFDFDGTLTRPGAIDFNFIKTALGCPVDQPVLEFINAMTNGNDRRAAMDRLNRFEADAAANSRPNTGAQEVIFWLKGRRIQVGIITRNSRYSVVRSLENFDQIREADFDVIITRDDPLAPKPSGDGVRHAAGVFGVVPRKVLMVGDYVFDPLAGKAAGAITVLLDPKEDIRLRDVDCDFRISDLGQLQSIIRNGMPLTQPTGMDTVPPG